VFLPTRIHHPYERAAIVTTTLMGVNLAVFVAQWTVMSVRTQMSLAIDPEAFAPHQLLTSAFLHLDVLHLVGNMLFLWVYGRYVEDRLGHGRYLGVYLAFAVAGSLGHLLMGGDRPAVGASGAISGLMGFVLVAAPWVEIEVRYVFVRWVSEPHRIAAFWLLGAWVAMQLLLALGASTGVAVMAHLGGFAGGAALAALLRSDRAKGTAWYVDPAPPGGGVASTRRLRASRGSASSAPRPPVHLVVLQRLEDAPSRVAIVKLLMRCCGLSPDRAKAIVDAVAEGTPSPVNFAGRDEADAFASEARTLGVVAVLRSEPEVPAPSVRTRASTPASPTGTTQGIGAPPERTSPSGFEIEDDR
jgi:membrane associated rhomboid family serine protease